MVHPLIGLEQIHADWFYLIFYFTSKQCVDDVY